jgi:integrase
MAAKKHHSAQDEEKRTKWTVERGSATVKIYLTPHGAENYYTLSYWMDRKRRRQVFKTLQEAKDEAAIKATQMTNGDLGAAKLTNADSAAYLRAIALLKPCGAALEFAASEYASAVKRLGAVSLSQAVDFYLKRHPVHMEPKMVRAVVDELLKLKESEQLSVRYRKQLAYDLNRFAGRFCGRLGDVAGTEIDAWLRDLKVGPRTRNNLRNSVQALFNFAISRRYLPTDHDELNAVPLARDGDGEIEIYSPEEMAELLAVASPEHIPFLAISAFAGVRHAELQRLDWSHVKRRAGIIEIKAGTAKTASRRVIPILPNLRCWLKDHWREAGEICNYANMVLQFVELTRRVNEKRRAAWAKANGVSKAKLLEADNAAVERLAKLPRNQRRSRRSLRPGAETAEDEGWNPFLWKHNALRHSFISYRVAQTQNVAQVALEAGNSPGMIFKHYRELVREADGKKWFAIAPKKSPKKPKPVKEN